MKDFFKKYLKDFNLAILAGIAISIGCIVFLAISNKVVGAVFFAVGLLSILAFQLNLFTGKAPYICKNKPSYLIFILVVWLGNFIGTALTAFLIRFTTIYNNIIERCAEVATAKSSDTVVSLFILGIFCGILMFIAVETFNRKTPFYSAITIILCVSTFILAGFEHSVADMFYFILAAPIKYWIIPLISISVGNAVGGNIFCLICDKE